MNHQSRFWAAQRQIIHFDYSPEADNRFHLSLIRSTSDVRTYNKCKCFCYVSDVLHDFVVRKCYNISYSILKFIIYFAERKRYLEGLSSFVSDWFLHSGQIQKLFYREVTFNQKFVLSEDIERRKLNTWSLWKGDLLKIVAAKSVLTVITSNDKIPYLLLAIKR